MALTEGLLKSTDYSLDGLTIVSSTGAVVDISGIFHELTVFEDLFSPTMVGSVLINDTNNLLNLLPIVGTEYLSVEFSKPGTPLKMSKIFRIYKISDRRKSNQQSEHYVLHFCSEELILNESIKISKSYHGMPVSDIVFDIARMYLQIDPKKFPRSAVSPTIGNIDVVIPYWTPFYTISWLSRMARTGRYPGCTYMFFEDQEGFHFAPIEALTQQTPLQQINFSPANIVHEQSDISVVQQRHESAEGYDFVSGPNTLESISTGAYAGKLVTINPLDQRINVHSMDASVLFDQTSHLNAQSIIRPTLDRTNTLQTNHYDAYFRVAADNLKVHEWLLQRNMYLSSLHIFQFKVVIGGSMYFRVGQVVQLNVPAAEGPSPSEKPIDQLYSGKYLITAIRHKIDRTKYICILEVSKDSLTQEFPTAGVNTAALKQLRRS
jgi:hypothetical protein